MLLFFFSEMALFYRRVPYIVNNGTNYILISPEIKKKKNQNQLMNGPFDKNLAKHFNNS